MSENVTGSGKTPINVGYVFAVKAGMTRVYNEEGESVAVTVLSLKDDSVVTQVKTLEKDGYLGLQVGIKSKKQQNTNKAEKGHFQKSGSPGFHHIEEIRLSKVIENAELGSVLSPEFLKAGLVVDIRGTTIGKGFHGVMKAWNFGGMPSSHGHSVSHRSPGSIGNRADPGRVFPGHKMATHLGMETKTAENITVVSYDGDEKLLLVKGSVPGIDNAIVRVGISKKKGHIKPAGKE